MGFVFRPAVRSQTSLLTGLAGPSGSGKTLSALKLARGMVGDDRKIFVIDTEAGRALHYACAKGEKPGPSRFMFQHVDLTAPFSPARYGEAIQDAVTAGAGVVVVDSMSHEHEGTGGILEMHEAILQRMGGNDYAKRERMTFAAWIEPKAAHNKFVNSILQQRAHLIFCFRAKDKMKLVKNDQGKIVPMQLGWTAICADRLEYEMACLIMLPPNGKGVPDLAAPSTKLQEAHRPLFPAGKPVSEDAGKALAKWAHGAAETVDAHGEIHDATESGSPARNTAAATPEPQTVAEGGEQATAASDGYDAEAVRESLWQGALDQRTVPELDDYWARQETVWKALHKNDRTVFARLLNDMNVRRTVLGGGSGK